METRAGKVIPFIEQEKPTPVPKTPSIETRQASLIPILEEPCLEVLKESRLPTQKEVFLHYFFLKKDMKNRVAKRKAIQAAEKIWESISIKPKATKNGIRILNRLLERYEAKKL